jgi:hypothetical protein
MFTEGRTNHYFSILMVCSSPSFKLSFTFVGFEFPFSENCFNISFPFSTLMFSFYLNSSIIKI